MSFYNSIKKIKNKIFHKQICILTGNVDDFIIPSSLDIMDGLDNNQMIGLPQYLSYLFHESGYNTIKYFNPSVGTINAENGMLYFDEEEMNPEEEHIINTSTQMFIQDITTEMAALKKFRKLNKKRAYIIDFSEMLLSSYNMELATSKVAELIASFVSNFNKSIASYLDFSPKLVLICRNRNLLTQFLSMKNIETNFHSIQKPNLDERKFFLSKFSSAFNFVNNYSLLDGNELDDATMLTNNMTFREILQMIKISRSEDFKDFKSLYNLIMFDKKESEWERIDDKKIKSIKQFLSERVKGQDEAIEQIKQTIIRSYVGLSGIAQSAKSRKPKGILFFAGPTGVGKTELAKALTEFVFGDESKFIRFDMSEYNLEHSDQKLIGAPPGYVGYESGGQLTNAVKENPFSILLFDEIEKAHERILDKFLQILEDGRLTSSKGELIDFSETFIIFTSNIGSDLITNINSNHNVNKKIYLDAIKDFFINKINRPEILNRIGIKNIIPFNHILDFKVIKEILYYKFEILKDKLLQEKNINLSPRGENDFLELVELIQENYQIRLGGRGLVVTFESIFIDELVNFIFKNLSHQLINKTNNIYSVDYFVENKKIQFEFKKHF